MLCNLVVNYIYYCSLYLLMYAVYININLSLFIATVYKTLQNFKKVT